MHRYSVTTTRCRKDPAELADGRKSQSEMRSQGEMPATEHTVGE